MSQQYSITVQSPPRATETAAVTMAINRLGHAMAHGTAWYLSSQQATSRVDAAIREAAGTTAGVIIHNLGTGDVRTLNMSVDEVEFVMFTWFGELLPDEGIADGLREPA